MAINIELSIKTHNHGHLTAHLSSWSSLDILPTQKNPGLIIEKINSNHLLILIRYQNTTIIQLHDKYYINITLYMVPKENIPKNNDRVRIIWHTLKSIDFIAHYITKCSCYLINKET